MTQSIHLFGRRRLAGAATLAMVGSSLALIAGPAPVAHAASTDGALTVRVVRDFGGTGTYNPVIDSALSGVTVKITDNSGHAVTLLTDATGAVTIPAGDTRLVGGKYRVDVTNPLPGKMYPAPAQTDPSKVTPSATEISPNTEFVDVSNGKDATDTTAFWYPHDYCQSNPRVANACQPGIYFHGGAGEDTTARPTLFTTNYNDSAYTSIADSAASGKGVGTGSLYGVAYNRKTKVLYSAAYAKRNVAYGDGGAGGIYVTTMSGTPATSVYAEVPNVGPNGAPTASATQHDMNSKGTTEDAAFIPAVGRESLGALMISNDYTKLFAVNEGDKKVYVYDVSDPSVRAGTPQTITTPNPCETASDWRPMGLGEDDGTLYVGGVCSGEAAATAVSATMKAVVYTFDDSTLAPLNGGSPVLDQPINYVRGGDGYACKVASGGALWAGWFAWNDKTWCGGSSQTNAPQPMLGKIVVEANGNLDLAFRDRLGDLAGQNLQIGVVGGGNINPYIQAGGDLNLACKDNTGMYIIDSNGGCGVSAVAAGEAVNRFYTTKAPGLHPNAAFAGMTMSRAEAGLITDEMDGAGAINAQALNVKNRTTGADSAWQQIGDASGFTNNSFGKGQGLADMDVLCDMAPVQIGNKVWYNTSADGKEHPGEAPVIGATVNLYDANGQLVGTTTTDANGNYYFDSRTTAGLKPNEKYTVKMNNPADYGSGGPLDTSKWGLTAAGDNLGKMAGGYPAINLTTGDNGQNDHTYDFGFKPIPKIHIVKFDGRLAQSPNNPATQHDNNVKNPVVYKSLANGTTGRQPVHMIATNTGGAVLANVTVGDTTISDPKMTGLTCDFSALGGPSSGTFWKGRFQPGDSFPCVGYVNLIAGQTHADQINISGVQIDPLTGARTPGVAPLTDFDRYYARTSYVSKLGIDKYDAQSKAPADFPSTAVRFKGGETRTIAMPATNLGTSPLAHVTIWDTTIGGVKMQNLTCKMPDGSVAKANSQGAVVWAASFWAKPHRWMPGQHIFCTGTLTMPAGAPVHGDQINIKATDPSGKWLGAHNRYYATVPPAAAHTGL